MLTLSIDDSKAATDHMTYMLKKIDPDGTHLAANTVSEAMSMMSHDVQIVFLNIEMPGINGIQLADKLRKEYENLNIIFVTGYPEYSFEAYSVRPSGFLAKPVTEKDIAQFKRQSTMELFAYLVYKKGAYCTNGNIIAVLWGGDIEKQAYLRKLLSDMRKCFGSVGLDDVIAKKYGKTCVDMNKIQCVGNPSEIAEKFGWIE